MAETQAASSPAEMQDPFNGIKPTMVEFSQYRNTGEIPERAKTAAPAESAPADSPEEKVVEPESAELETAPESEPEEEAQEQPQKGSAAERRIKQLLAKQKELERKLADLSKPTPAAPSTAESKPAPANRPKPTAEDKTADGKPKYGTYEDFVEDLADWKAEQSLARFRQQQAQEASQREFQKNVSEARERYEDFDEVVEPAAAAIIGDKAIPDLIKQRLAKSKVASDLMYTLGADEDDFQAFVKKAKSDPFGALDYIAHLEKAIREEFAAPQDKPKAGKAPEPKRTQAPKPPSPVNSGGSSRAFDASDTSLSPEEWMRKRTADLKKRGKTY